MESHQTLDASKSTRLRSTNLIHFDQQRQMPKKEKSQRIESNSNKHASSKNESMQQPCVYFCGKKRGKGEKTIEKEQGYRSRRGGKASRSRDDPGCIYLYGPGRSYLLAVCTVGLHVTLIHRSTRELAGRLAARNRACL